MWDDVVNDMWARYRKKLEVPTDGWKKPKGALESATEKP